MLHNRNLRVLSKSILKEYCSPLYNQKMSSLKQKCISSSSSNSIDISKVLKNLFEKLNKSNSSHWIHFSKVKPSDSMDYLRITKVLSFFNETNFFKTLPRKHQIYESMTTDDIKASFPHFKDFFLLRNSDFVHEIENLYLELQNKNVLGFIEECKSSDEIFESSNEELMNIQKTLKAMNDIRQNIDQKDVSSLLKEMSKSSNSRHSNTLPGKREKPAISKSQYTDMKNGVVKSVSNLPDDSPSSPTKRNSSFKVNYLSPNSDFKNLLFPSLSKNDIIKRETKTYFKNKATDNISVKKDSEIGKIISEFIKERKSLYNNMNASESEPNESFYEKNNQFDEKKIKNHAMNLSRMTSNLGSLFTL